MKYYLQKELNFHNSVVVVYYRRTTFNENIVWTDKLNEAKGFSLKTEVTNLSNSISESTRIIKK